MCKDMPPLLPRPDSIVAMRAPFATHSLWVAPYDEKQIYPAGKFVPRKSNALEPVCSEYRLKTVPRNDENA